MVRELSVHELARLCSTGTTPLLVDVREPWEHALCALPASRLIPLGELAERLDELEDTVHDAAIVAYCHHGVRSRGAAAILAASGRTNLASLAGGIDAWARLIDPTVPRY